MIRPPLRSRFAASRSVLKVPFRLIAIRRSNSASSLSAIGASRMMPALFTSTSTPPKAASAVSNMRDRGRVADVGLGGEGPAAGLLDLRDQRLGAPGLPA